MGIADIELLAEWTKNPVLRRFLSKVDLSENPGVGINAGKDGRDGKIVALLTNLLDISLHTLDVSGSNLSPSHLSALAPCDITEVGSVKEFRFKETKFKKAIKTLTLTSTGGVDMDQRRQTYTLKAVPPTKTIDLKNQFLGSGDLCLIGMWLSKPEVISVVEEIDLSRCPVTNSSRPEGWKDTVMAEDQIAETAEHHAMEVETKPERDVPVVIDAWVRDTLDSHLDGLAAVCSSLSAYRYGKRKKVAKTLTLVDSGIGTKGCMVLAKLISSCGALLGIDISQNIIEIAGARAIGSVVRAAHAKHQSLHWLKLGSAETVTIPISKKKIKELDLSKAALPFSIGPVEAAVLGGALLTMPSIRKLNLSGQPVASIGGQEEVGGLEDVLASLKDNGSVNTLVLENCGLEERSEQALAHFLHNNGVINSLNLLGNPFPKGVKNVVACYNMQETIDTLCGFKMGTRVVDWAGAGRLPADMALLQAEMEPGTGRRALEHLQTLDLSGEQNFDKDFEKTIKLVRKAGSTYRSYIWQRKTYYKGIDFIPADPKNRHDLEQPGAPEFSDSDEEGSSDDAAESSGSEYYDSSDENDASDDYGTSDREDGSDSEVRNSEPQASCTLTTKPNKHHETH
eukprot:COSAG02_NODE_7949_length_2775_cov_1.554559_2_plen_625_part_00